ncbi:hypothetical protein HYT23_00415 [Candidatus Pacearchaeota archaeon]|nr:hypothetical protein [Candidatus Pacearchaeota archaeon]
MKNNLIELALIFGLAFGSSSCMFPVQTGIQRKRPCWPEEKIPAWKLKDAFQNHRFGHYYYMCSYYSYPARIGDDFFVLYTQEDGYENDSLEFKEFQRGILRETKKKGDIDCLKWQDSILTVVKNGFIMIPDANRNGLPGD